MNGPDSVSLRARFLGALALLVGILLLAASPRGFAAQSLACTATPATANLSLASVSIPPTQANGLIGSPISVQVTFNCKDAFFNTNNYSDNFTLMTGNFASAFDPAPPPGSTAGIMFKTNLNGIYVQLTAAQNQASAGGNGPNGSNGWVIGEIDCAGTTSNWNCQPSNVLVTFTAQLVKTGAVTAGTTNSINLLQFFDQDFYCNNYFFGRCFGYQQATSSTASGTLILNPVSVSVSGCVLAADPTVVTLPTVNASAFGAKGSTAGQTPFTIQLSCSPGTKLGITLATAAPVAGTTGVIANTTGAGYAQNVGVQITDWSSQPITFGSLIQAGTSQTGAFNIPFFARYYQTGAVNGSVTGGAVSATATYTLTYQ